MSSQKQNVASRRQFLKIAATTAASAILAACGGSPTAPTSNSADTAANTGSATSAASTGSSLPAVELTYIYPGTIYTDLAAVQNKLNEVIQPKINATIKLQATDWGAFDEKIKLATAAGEKFDLMFTAPWINNYYQNITNGNLVALDELLQNHAPGLWASMPPTTWEAARVKGKIYGVINQQIFVKPWGPFTRKDLAEKHGLDLSGMTKFEDLEPYYEKVKGEGIYPLTPAENLFYSEYWGFDPLFDGGFVVRYNDTNRKVLLAAETPEFAEAARLTRKWVQAGFIPEEELASDDERAQFRAGKFAGGIHVIKPGGDSEAKTIYGYDFVQRSFVKPHNSTEILTTAGVVATLTGISRTSANPERAMMFLELLNTDPEVYNLLSKGIEGTHWVWADKDRKIIGFPEGVTPETSTYNPNTDWMFGNQFNAYFVSEDQATANVWQETAKLNKEATPSVALGFAFDSEPVKTELSQLAAVGEELGEPIGFGLVDVDEALPKYIAALKEAGADKVLAETQRQLDEWAKSKA
jgi:putative aldouronate transport system substrate-binding protein